MQTEAATPTLAEQIEELANFLMAKSDDRMLPVDAEHPRGRGAVEMACDYIVKIEDQCDDLIEASTEQAILIEGAQAILTSYLIPDGIDAAECVSRLLGHLDGPEQRRVKALHLAATSKAEA